MIRNLFIFSFLFLFLYSKGFSQSSVNSSGSEADGNDGTVSYSVGQVFTNESDGGQGTVTEGVQQSFVVTQVDVDDTESIDATVKVFPNPVNNRLNIEFQEFATDVNLRLYGLNGKNYRNRKINNSKLDIDMKDMASGTYFLELTDGKGNKELYKIVKR